MLTGYVKVLWLAAGKEIKRSPIATLAIIIGSVGAPFSFFIAGFSSYAQVQNPLAAGVGDSAAFDAINIKNVFLVMSFFLFVSFFGAGISRLLARKYDIPAAFLSIVIAATSNFLTIVLIYLAPPRARSDHLFQVAHNSVFYASLIIYLTVCGAAVLRDVLRSGSPAKASDGKPSGGEESNIPASIVLLVVLIAAWGWLVFAGQKRLSDTFLPSIAHYQERPQISK